MQFATIDIKQSKELLDFLGNLPKNDAPCLIAFNPTDMKKYKISAKDLTVEAVTKFVEDIQNGALPVL